MATLSTRLDILWTTSALRNVTTSSLRSVSSFPTPPAFPTVLNIHHLLPHACICPDRVLSSASRNHRVPTSASLIQRTRRHGQENASCRLYAAKTGSQFLHKKSVGSKEVAICCSSPKNESQSETEETEQSVGSNGESGSLVGLATSGVLWAVWAGFIAYVAAFGPDQIPEIDKYFVEKLLFLHQDDGFSVNPILFSIWNIMGVWPAIYTALLIPSGRSEEGGVPVWPFATLSVGTGIFALLPYFALWRPSNRPLPSSAKQESVALKVLESKITALALIAGAVGLLGYAALNLDGWPEYYQLFRSSRLVHTVTLDFCFLTLLCPFWLYNDMEVRNWGPRDLLIIPLSLLPVIGPTVYLFLRPSLPAEPLQDEPTSS